MGPTVAIRPAAVDDARAIATLLDLGSLHPGAEDVTDVSGYAAVIADGSAQSSAVLVAEVDGVVVGVVQIFVFRHLQHRGGLCAELESMHVHPMWRGHGIGGTLLEAAAERAASLGCYRLQLTSNLVRPDAHRFYEAHGFTASHRGFKRSLTT